MRKRKNPHWPLARKGKKYGPNSQPYTPLCLWCGVEFRAARPDAITCNTAHRVALNRYVKKHGQPPMFPFGAVLDKKVKK